MELMLMIHPVLPGQHMFYHFTAEREVTEVRLVRITCWKSSSVTSVKSFFHVDASIVYENIDLTVLLNDLLHEARYGLRSDTSQGMGDTLFAGVVVALP